jgi:hypothetical protein
MLPVVVSGNVEFHATVRGHLACVSQAVIVVHGHLCETVMLQQQGHLPCNHVDAIDVMPFKIPVVQADHNLLRHLIADSIKLGLHPVKWGEVPGIAVGQIHGI